MNRISHAMLIKFNTTCFVTLDHYYVLLNCLEQLSIEDKNAGQVTFRLLVRSQHQLTNPFKAITVKTDPHRWLPWLLSVYKKLKRYLLCFRTAFYETRSKVVTIRSELTEVFCHYTSQLLQQFHVLVLGADVLGNPYSLVPDFTEGFGDLFYEPYLVSNYLELSLIVYMGPTSTRSCFGSVQKNLMLSRWMFKMSTGYLYHRFNLNQSLDKCGLVRSWWVLQNCGIIFGKPIRPSF